MRAARGLPLAVLLAAVLLLAGCGASTRQPLAQAQRVDLARFMGDWYVIASIPTLLERDAYNALESYRLAADGSIETTFSFREGAFDGPERRYSPRGFVLDRANNATWEMQFVWPFRADYRIAYLAADYSHTVIARERRDYVWIMARTPQVADDDYRRLERFVAAQGYDTARLRKVPQRWPAERAGEKGASR
jgi:apolipoprotein D and lipocalin family protein